TSAIPRFDLVSAVQGLLVGMLAVLLFPIPPLLGIRYIRPALIFRREMAAPRQTTREWLTRASGSLISAAVILLFVGAVAAWLSESRRVGIYFVVAIVAGIGTLAAVAWILLRALHWLSRHLPRSAGPVVRQGIANLYRP